MPAKPSPVLDEPEAGPGSLLASLLADQRRLDTPVIHAGAAYDALGQDPLSPRERFRDLVPLSRPGAGEQYAFEVDLDACSGCKACVAACHSLNGLDETEAWRDVGHLVSGDPAQPWTQTVTTACHHCLEPACLQGCPVAAYEKDPWTGIVRHLDDQCIGCSYCILKCPYDVPKFNERLGIVRKCDLCHQRLSAGEAPACVQSCPTEAIRVVAVSTFQTRAEIAPDFLTAAPDPSITLPTTRYLSNRAPPDRVRAADADTLRVQPAHVPLVVMLVFTQSGLGLFNAAAWDPQPHRPLLGLSAGLILSGVAASTLHLGRPLRAWRFFLGLKTSWLSREILVFGLLPPLLGAILLSPSSVGAKIGLFLASVVAVTCSAMIYVDTKRGSWRPTQTALRFGGTALVFALGVFAPIGAALVLLAKLGAEATQLTGSSMEARLLRGPLKRFCAARYAFGLSAVALFLIAPLWASLAATLVGELLERLLYFRAVKAPRMPGIPANP